MMYPLTAQTNANDADMSLAPAGGDWLLDVGVSGVSRRLTPVDIANTRIEVANGAAAADVDAANPLTLTFSGDGEVAGALLGGAVLDPRLGIEFRVIGDSTRIVCLHPTGYSSAGPC